MPTAAIRILLRMTRFTLVVATMMAGLALPRTAAAQSPSAWLGTWTLNVE